MSALAFQNRSLETCSTVPGELRPSAILGRAIRELRLEGDLTQEALAHQSGVTVGQLSKIEREQSDPRWSTVMKIAKGLQVPMPTLWEKVEAVAGRQERVGT